MHIENEDAIARMPNLRKLSFGVYHFDDPPFLATLDLTQITRLVLSDNKKKNFDLSPLENCTNLDELFLNGHLKSIAALSHLPKLTKLSLGSIAKGQKLKFVNEIPNLDKLTIILGGRENIDEIEHASLNGLEVVRVRGFNYLGDLSRFPNLRRLRVEDQIQLRNVSFTGSNLEEVSIHNCKNLDRLDGLLDLQGLRHFRTSRTKLDLDSLVEANWPDSMETVAVYSGSEKWNVRARSILDEKGFGEYSQKN
jgi:Leucine-rich repeat (LRR) protein